MTNSQIICDDSINLLLNNNRPKIPTNIQVSWGHSINVCVGKCLFGFFFRILTRTQKWWFDSADESGPIVRTLPDQETFLLESWMTGIWLLEILPIFTAQFYMNIYFLPCEQFTLLILIEKSEGVWSCPFRTQVQRRDHTKGASSVPYGQCTKLTWGGPVYAIKDNQGVDACMY